MNTIHQGIKILTLSLSVKRKRNSFKLYGSLAQNNQMKYMWYIFYIQRQKFKLSISKYR